MSINKWSWRHPGQSSRTVLQKSPPEHGCISKNHRRRRYGTLHQGVYASGTPKLVGGGDVWTKKSGSWQQASLPQNIDEVQTFSGSTHLTPSWYQAYRFVMSYVLHFWT